MTKPKPVTIVGGGWAGLTTAVELVRHDIPVLLLESAKQLGGRARRVPFTTTGQPDYNPAGNNDNELSIHDRESDDTGNTDKISIDNGQHLLIGAYDSTLSALRTVGVSEDSVLKREKLQLIMRRVKARDVRIETGRLPAPLHLAWGLLFSTGLTFSDRIRTLQFCRAMLKSGFTIPGDTTCLKLFRQYGQTINVIKTLWEPLCIAALNTPIETASATVFLRILREAFAYSRSESDFLYTRMDLGSIYPDHAMEYIEKHGGTIRLGQRVSGLLIDDRHSRQLKGIKLQEGEIISDHVVLATSHFAAQKLLAPHDMFADICARLGKLGAQPIVTVYLQYPEEVTIEVPMIGFVGTTAQWIFDRRICGQPGLMAVVISSNGPHMEMSNDVLATRVQKELAEFYPHWPKPANHMVIREKRATFNCASSCNDYRPGNKTPLQGLWLAGDYTDTHLPATLESAVRSGKRCAQSIVKAIRQSGDEH